MNISAATLAVSSAPLFFHSATTEAGVAVPVVTSITFAASVGRIRTMIDKVQIADPNRLRAEFQDFACGRVASVCATT